MARLRTRVQLAARFRLEYRTGSQVQYPPADIYSTLDTVYATLWEYVTGDQGSGYGEVADDLTATANQSYINLPADFMDLRSVRRSIGSSDDLPQRRSRSWYNAKYPNDELKTLPGVYWLEGPVIPATDAQRIELRPIPATAETVPIVYVPQAPTFSTDETQLDLFYETVEAAVIHMVGVRLTLRSDQGAQAKAERQLSDALDKVRWIRDRRDGAGPDLVDNYQNGWHYS